MNDSAEIQINTSQNARRGRGAVSNQVGRFERHSTARFDDGWNQEKETTLKTTVTVDNSKSILSKNQSPDIPFDRSINPYRGCEHGCIYCFARPTHAYLGKSPGLDFETQLFAKPNAAKLLENTLRKPTYKVAPIAIGTNTDPYQPIEKKWQIMREILMVLRDYHHPVTIVTKGAMVVRDIDILGEMGRKGLARVALSITTLDPKLSRLMEPRASVPQRRLWAIKQLNRAGIPTSVMIAPIIPKLNDHELESILQAAKAHGATGAGYVALRMPLEIKDLFREWLHENYPDRADRIIRYIREMHGGKDYDPEWGKRLSGEGVYAELLKRRFITARKRLELSGQDRGRGIHNLRCNLFKIPPRIGDQMELFG